MKSECPNYTRAIADNLAGFAYEDIPGEVVDRTKLILLDTLGALLAASSPKYSAARIIIDFVKAQGGEPQASIIGRDFKTSAVNAALANGTLGYLCDIEAHHPEAILHPVAIVVPTCLAVGEYQGSSGRDVLAAMALGVEMGTRVCIALDAPILHRKGLHPSGIGGVFGAVAAAGHLLGLEREAWVSALGLASNQASGTLNWTSDPTENSRPFNPGVAARNGVTAALLAKAGFGGPRDVFEGKYDFFTAFSDTRHPEALVEGWGRRYAITELAVKRYPTVAQSHSGLDGLLEIRDEQGLTIEEISKIDLRIAPLATRVIDNNIMRSHCAQYVLAVAALRGKVEPEDVLLSDHRSDPRVQRLFENIRVIPDDDLAGTYPEHYETIIEVTTTGGEIHMKRVLSARGLPDNPMTREEVLDKFLVLATTVVSRERADEIVRMVDGVEALSDIRDLARLLVVKS